MFHKRAYKKMNPLTANTKLSINKKTPESYDSDGFSPSVIIGFRKVASDKCRGEHFVRSRYAPAHYSNYVENISDFYILLRHYIGIVFILFFKRHNHSDIIALQIRKSNVEIGARRKSGCIVNGWNWRFSYWYYFTYDEFSAWIENETENIQKLVDAGEWTEAEATEALEYYDEILKSILEGKMVGKRASSSDDQLFFSMPDNAQPEQYQTFVFDGNTYKSIGPFDTEEELFNALKEYTDTEVEAGTMSQAEATALLEKYQ